MAKEYKHGEETFLLDDSQGCYTKVTHAKHSESVGYVGVNLRDGSKKNPYIWDGNPGGASHVTPDGLTGWGWDAKVDTIQNALNGVCGYLTSRIGESEFGKDQKEQACGELHKFVENL